MNWVEQIAPIEEKEFQVERYGLESHTVCKIGAGYTAATALHE
jgi:hypothetical protein